MTPIYTHGNYKRRPSFTDKAFKTIAISALAYCVLSDFAQATDAANANAPVTNASMSIGHNPTGQELCLEWKEKAKQAFPVICALNDKEIVVQDVLENGSHNRFLVGVWGGNDDHRTEAIRVVNRMYRDGKKVGIVFGPDRDTYLEEKFRGLDAEFEPYAHGQNGSLGTSTIGLDNLHMIRGELETMLNESYDVHFPQKFASNTSYGAEQTPK